MPAPRNPAPVRLQKKSKSGFASAGRLRYDGSMAVTQQFEVEVKVLLGDQSAAEEFVSKLRSADPTLSVHSQSSQLNHYFDQDGKPAKLLEMVKSSLTAEDYASLQDIVETAERFALRTRQDDGGVRLVIKAAKGDEDEQHAVQRLEGDYLTDEVSIDHLDRLILEAGYSYLSKWSRQRTTYQYKSYTVCIDRNAGYGHLAEFEKLVDGEDQAEQAKAEILQEITRLGVEELPQDRLGRMFAHYNEHWPEYYQTDKTFTVE